MCADDRHRSSNSEDALSEERQLAIALTATTSRAA